MQDSQYPKYWSEAEQRYYRMRYDSPSAQWVFHDWLPRRDSVQQHSHGPSSNAGSAALGEGHRIRGTYDTNDPTGGALHYESLDPLFYVRPSNYFQEGRVFAVLFTEAAGTTALNRITDYNTALSRVRYNEWAHTQVRRFIVVRRRHEFCFAVPIFGYSGQGTKKYGVLREKHAIAYSWNGYPQLLQGEQALSKSPICIVMSPGESQLHQASRIYFGIHHPIQFNVKVKDLGYVHADYMTAFLGYWNMENGYASQQTPDAESADSTNFDNDNGNDINDSVSDSV